MHPDAVDRSRFRSRQALALAAAAGLAILSGGASSPHKVWRAPAAALGRGFFDRTAPPPPEGTIHPEAGSWDDVHPPASYRVVLLTGGDDAATATLVDAVERWAQAEHASIEHVFVTRPDRQIDGIVQALRLKPELIISAGRLLVDALALVTASHLDQQFLIVGAQLPEPTANVTAAVWPGAASRGGEVPDSTASFNPAAFTPQHADAAIRAGVASVLSGLTGIVVSLD